MQLYTRPHLLALIQGTNGSDTRTPRGSHIKHTRNPVPAPVDTDSFLRMFHAYTLDYYRFQSRRASPGGNVTVLTAGELSSQQIVTDEDDRPGILKTDCLGQRHLYSSAYIRSSDNVFSNIPVRENLRLWLVMDDFAKEDKLKKWWEAAENRQSALEIQVHLVRSFNELYGRIRPRAAAAVTTRQILEWPLVAYNDTVSSILTGFSTATPSGGPPTEETGPGQTRSLLNEKVEFDQLRRMVGPNPKSLERSSELTFHRHGRAAASKYFGPLEWISSPSSSTPRRLFASSLPTSTRPTWLWSAREW